MEDIKNEDVKAVVEAAKPKLPEFDKDELLRVFDEIIFEGEYSEEVSIKGKLKVVFRARSVEDTTSITREIDGKNFALITTLQEQRALLNLAYSLVSYSGKDLGKMEIEERKKFINKLPAAVVAALSQELSKFDLKVDMACREGEANF